MAVLVTGGAGYIGCHMVLALLDAGEEVVVLDNLSTGFWWAIPEEAAFVQGDSGDQELVARIIREHSVSAIIHFAAKLIVPESVSDPLGYYANNTVKTRALIEAAVQGGVKQFIFSSTAAVYGETSSEPVSETTPLNPVSPYGKSKLMSEWMLSDVGAAHGLSFVVLRYFNVAGADPKGRVGQSTANATHLIKVAAQAALGKRAGMEVFGTDYATRDGSCVRDYIQVSDLAQAHLDALTYLRAGGQSGVFNCGYGTGYTVLEVIKTVKQVSGVDFPVKLSARRAGDPAVIVAQSDLIRATLGWTPKHDNLEQIVTQALNWEEALARRNAK